MISLTRRSSLAGMLGTPGVGLARDGLNVVGADRAAELSQQRLVERAAAGPLESLDAASPATARQGFVCVLPKAVSSDVVQE